jgi:hypothetical protein
MELNCSKYLWDLMCSSFCKFSQICELTHTPEGCVSHVNIMSLLRLLMRDEHMDVSAITTSIAERVPF